MAKIEKSTNVIKSPNPVDIHVGTRLRSRRLLLGMSQEELGKSVGLTFQQVQKYERGTNRVSASRLYELSHILQVPTTFFFDGLPDDDMANTQLAGFSDKGQDPFQGEDLMVKKETIDLIRAYYNIEDTSLRKQIMEMAKAMASSSSH